VHYTRMMPRNRSVLVVDDDPLVRRLMAVMVAQDGYAALEAKSGAEALHLAEANRIDLLVTDVEMPGMNGLELVLVLKQRGLIERSLLVTGNVDSINHFHGLHSPVPLLAKPFNAGQLLGMIHALLSD
jgi:CheY-like chemotaxis protein